MSVEGEAGAQVRTYRVRRGWQASLYLACVGFLALAGGIAYMALTATEGNPRAMGVIAAVVAVGALVGLLDTWRSKVVLDGDRLTILGLRRRDFPRDELEGYRRFVHSGTAYLVLVRRAGGTAKLPLIFDSDPAFDAWVSSLPDLDARDAAEADAEMREHADARTEAGVDAQLDLARQLARVVNIGAYVAVAWAVFYPRPYWLATLTCAVIPLLSMRLMMRFRGIIAMDGKPAEQRPHVALGLIIPGMGLGLRALFDYQVIDLLRLCVTGTLVALAMTGLAVLAQLPEQRKWGASLPFAIVLLAYGIGGACIANVRFDRGAPAHHTATVLDKRITRGKQTRHLLELSPWGPRATIDDVNVTPAQYAAIAVGDDVELHVHSGALRIRWFHLAGLRTEQ